MSHHIYNYTKFPGITEEEAASNTIIHPPRKSDNKNTIESWPQFQFLFRKRVLTEFVFIKTQKLVPIM